MYNYTHCKQNTGLSNRVDNTQIEQNDLLLFSYYAVKHVDQCELL